MRDRVASLHVMAGMTPAQARSARRLDLLALAAIALSVPAVVLGAQELGGARGTAVLVLEWAIWLSVGFELVLMRRIAPDFREWLRPNWLFLAIVVVTPPFVPDGVQVLWLIRLVRALELAPVTSAILSFKAFRDATIVTFLGVLGGGLLFAFIEPGTTVFDGVWWAMVTITTVGYGDIYPRTDAGRALGMGLMLVAPLVIGLVAVGVASITSAMIGRGIAASTEEIEAMEEHVEEEVQQVSRIEDEILRRLDAIDARLGALETAHRLSAAASAARRPAGSPRR